MKIKIYARSFFEARMGTFREAELFQNNRIISINSVSFPAEPPPFFEKYLHAPNLLTLFFDDVENDCPYAMTHDDAVRIVEFAWRTDPRPLLIHCTTGVSRSGAVGEVLNWYFNRLLEDNSEAYERFVHEHPDIVPNPHVRHTLLEVLKNLHRKDS